MPCVNAPEGEGHISRILAAGERVDSQLYGNIDLADGLVRLRCDIVVDPVCVGIARTGDFQCLAAEAAASSLIVAVAWLAVFDHSSMP